MVKTTLVMVEGGDNDDGENNERERERKWIRNTW